MDIGLEARARRHPDKLALVFGDRRVTFGDLDARTNQAARAFIRLGVRPGDTVACALKNSIEFYETTFAAARAGADIVPVSWRAKLDETEYLLSDSKAALLVAESDAPAVGVTMLHRGQEYEKALAAESHGAVDGGPDPAPPRFRMYTSGTTGRPKPVERPRPDVEAYLRGVVEHLGIFEVQAGQEVHVLCGPLYHSAPLGFSVYALLVGQTVVLLERFDPERFLAAVEAARGTWAMMVPIHFVRLLGLPEEVRSRYDVSSLRRIIHAAAPCPPDVKRRMIEMFPGDVVWEFYGMTESRATVISAREWVQKPGSVGRAMPDTRIKICSFDGGELPPGEEGLIYIAPPGPRFTYGGAPEKTEEAWRDEFFTVGDMGYLDADGYLYLTDRAQDMIISGGSNVYPAEVEAVLQQHPSVADVAVIGVPDEEWGERVHAIVEARASVDPPELIAFCREQLAHYKCPRSVEVVEQLARDPNGKVRKRELREPYWAGRARRI